MDDVQGCVNHLCSWAVTSCESSFQDISSINDLKEIDFGQSVPKHSLLLLHWFANVIDIDPFNTITLCDPNDFGSHHYGNYEDMLDPLPWGYKYYTVGNLNGGTPHELPDYVLHPPVREYEGNNMDRIIFRVQQTNLGIHSIDQVYLTQHYRQDDHQGTRYNPEHTYRISPNLLQEMRMFSVQNNHRSMWELRDLFNSNAKEMQLGDIRIAWGKELTCLGLLLFIVLHEKHSKDILQLHKESVSNKSEEAEEDGDTPIPVPCQEKIPEDSDLLEDNTKRQVESQDLNEQCHHPEKYGKRLLNVMDHLDPKVSHQEDAPEDEFNPPNNQVQDLPPNIMKLTALCLVVLAVCYLTPVLFGNKGGGSEHPDRVPIPGYKAHLEIVAKQHKACARIYLEEDFIDWRYKFEQSWVAFYKSTDKGTNQYEWGQWQWTTRFQTCLVSVKGYCIEYCSDMEAMAGVHARFILAQYTEIARTPSLHSPGGVKITGYGAHLQLFEESSKACARLYVKKYFTEWTDELVNSWVGFYSSQERGTHEYKWWQWATKFKQHNSYLEFNVFEYCSDIKATPGVHARFILNNEEKARTSSLHFY